MDGFGQASLIVGKTVAARAHRSALRTTGVDDGELLHRTPFLAFLSPSRYTEVAESHLFPLPEGSHR